MTDPARIARRARVHGRVQGVFFRDSTRELAQRVGVAGWVRNEGDGTVAAHLEGAPDAVEAVLAFLRVGPPHAAVDRVEVASAPDEGLTAFEVR
jgi:acylphosphatase